MVRACRVLPADGDNSWRLVPLGAGDFVQRRRHIRVTTSTKAHLLEDMRGRAVEVAIVDLSESGMRCSFTDYAQFSRATRPSVS